MSIFYQVKDQQELDELKSAVGLLNRTHSFNMQGHVNVCKGLLGTIDIRPANPTGKIEWFQGDQTESKDLISLLKAAPEYIHFSIDDTQYTIHYSHS